MPKPVRLAVKLIWISLIIRMVLNLLGTIIGMYLVGTFLITFSISVLIAVIAYQLAHGSNPALVVSAITIAGVLSAFAYHVPTIIFDRLDFLITIPLYMYSLYLLFFNKEASSWFDNNQKVI